MSRIFRPVAVLLTLLPTLLFAQQAPPAAQQAPPATQQAPAAAQQAPAAAQQAPPARQRPQAGEQQPDMGTLLIQGLQQTEGCLGVKTCQWDDGKTSIVAWFENKAAAQRWYYSDTHMGMIGGSTDGTVGDEQHAPLTHVEDDDTPIMVIASLTFSDRPELPGINIPISQISIEMFAPLPGGAQMNGRVSPEAFIVPEMNTYLETGNSDTASGAGG
ncbi:MAG: hypothetical protein AAF456_15965 [Planctomycetota bacterium]